MIRLLLSTALLVGSTTAASAQMKSSQPDAIAASVADCWVAVGPKAIDKLVLVERGWRAGSISDPRGGPVDATMGVFSKSGSNVVLLLMDNSPSCAIVSRVNRVADINLATQATQRRLEALDPQVKTARSGQSIVFLSLPKIAMLDGTGSKAKPGLRIVVGYQTPEKK